MQLQPQTLQSLGQRRPHLPSLPLGHAMHDRVVGLCRPADYADRGVNGLVGGVGTAGWSA